jgi:copper homeostasis protein CutC
VDAAKGRILIMPCGGINSNNVVQIVRTTLAREIHSSAGTSNLGSMPNGIGLPHNSGGTGASLPSTVFEQEVADLASLLDGVARMNDQ